MQEVNIKILQINKFLIKLDKDEIIYIFYIINTLKIIKE